MNRRIANKWFKRMKNGATVPIRFWPNMIRKMDIDLLISEVRRLASEGIGPSNLKAAIAEAKRLGGGA
jgi:hypothetical protein